MATSIKMAEHDKHRLDRLQGEIMALQGRRISQQELLSRLLDLAEAEKDRLYEDSSRPVTAREIRELMGLIVSTGVASREEDIDTLVVV